MPITLRELSTLNDQLTATNPPPALSDSLQRQIEASTATGSALIADMLPAITAAELNPVEADEIANVLADKSGIGRRAVKSQIKLAAGPGGQQATQADNGLEQSEVAAQVYEAIRDNWLWDNMGRSWYQRAGNIWTIREPEQFSYVCKMLVQDIVGKFTATFLAGVERLVRIDSTIIEPWCKRRDYLPFTNGVLNLSTGALMDYGEHRFCWCLPAEYDPAAKCPVYSAWVEFLSDGDYDAERMLDCVLAAIVRGMVHLQVFFEITGRGGSGKGAFQNLAAAIVGTDNVIATDLTNLARNQFETARLYEKRLTVLADADEFRGNMGMLKRITGQDPIRHEQKREKARSFIYTGMVLITGNQPIQGNDLSNGVFRRRVPLSFQKTPPRADEGFYKSLTDEIPGIIARIIAIPAEEIQQRIEDHREGEHAARVLHATNHLVAYVSERLQEFPGGSVPVGQLLRDPNTRGILRAETELYPSYVAWFESDNSGGKPLGKRGFAEKIVEACRMGKLSNVFMDKDWGKNSPTRGRVSITGIKIRPL